LFSGSAGVNVFGFNSANNIYFGKGSDNGGVLQWSNSTVRYYTLPNATGTLALTSDLTGGTVTSVGLSSATSGVTIGSTPITTSGTITLAIATASGSQQGLLSSTDWTTFNNKQPQLNGTGFVKASGTTISYDNSTYLTTSAASSTYLPLAGGTLTGALGGTSATFSGALTFANGGANYLYGGALRVLYSNGTNTNNIYSGGVNGLRVINQADTIALMQITDSGNLGLGVTPSAWFSDRKAIQLSAGASINSSASTFPFVELGANFFHGSLGDTYIGSSSASKYRQLSGGHEWYTAPSGTAGNAISFTQAMTLDASGRLAVGTSSFPNQNSGSLAGTAIFNGIVRISGSSARYFTSGNGLELAAGSIYSYNRDTASYNDLSINDAMLVKGGDNVGIGTTAPNFKTHISTGDTSSITQPTAGSYGLYIQQNTGGSVGGLYIQDGASNSGNAIFVGDNNGAARFVVNGDGNVGIGTSSPDRALTVNGQIGLNNDFVSTKGGTTFRIGYEAYTSTGGVNMFTEGSIPLVLGTNSTERMRITSGGNVGIATTPSSDNRLQIFGSDSTSSNFAITLQNSSAAVLFRVRNDGLIYTGTTSLSPYNYTTSNSSNCFIDSDGSLQRSTSSLKYKTNIRDYDKGLDIINQMRPVYYNGKNDGDTQFAGLIAEEIHALGLTEFVQYAKDGSPDALAYSNMIALLVKGMKELKQELDTLKK
jgi:hypothetical protein